MSDITIAQLTNKTVDEPGTGVFDLLMASNKLQLDEQWEDGKLTGAEYATVYLGAMQATLQQSVQFLLSEQEADAKADLLAAQEAEVLANTLRTDATALLNDALILEKTESENKNNEADGLMDQQIKDSIAAIALKAAQEAEVLAGTSRSDATALLNDALIVEKTETENLQNKTDGLIENQILKMQEDAKLAKSEADKSYAEMLANIDKEYGFDYTLDANDDLVRSSLVDAGDGKLDAEVLAMEKEGELKTAQILTETQNTILVTEKHESEAKQNVTDGVIDKQILDITAGTTLKSSQNAEVLDGTTRSGLESTSGIAVNSEQITSSIATTLRENALGDAKVILTNAQIEDMQEKVDLTIAQTAVSYEEIKSSQDKTIRDNLENNANILKINEEIVLFENKNIEEAANTVRQDTQSEAKVVDLNHDISIKAQQEYELEDKNGSAVTTYTFYVDGTGDDPTTTTATNLGAVKGVVLGTAMTGGGPTVVSLDKLILEAKEALILAQKKGFRSDTQQKLLAHMIEGYSVNTAVNAAVGTVPDMMNATDIQNLKIAILNDLDI